ncbi:MAG TPA: sigma-70 family RNA polymerase sigma factor, partial [Pyrinomonadaceae bacterium]
MMTTNAATFPIFQSSKGEQAAEQQPQQTDYSLAQRAASGDMACFESLYERHHRRVYSLCLRMTSNTAEAEDLAQEVFIQLFRKIGSFRGESAFTTWLHRLTVNQVLMHFRKK